MSIYVRSSLFATPSNLTLADCHVARTRSYTLVVDLIARWHSTLPNAPAGFRVAFLGLSRLVPIAAATWGRPVARLEEQETTLELTRLAHSPYVPRNFGSWALARMRRWIRVNMPDVTRLISYQDADAHDGALYRADNWQQVYEQRTTHSWNNRSGRLGTERKHRIKWEYRL